MTTRHCNYCNKSWPAAYDPVTSLFCEFSTTRDINLFFAIVITKQDKLIEYTDRQIVQIGPAWDDADTIFYQSFARMINKAQTYTCAMGCLPLWKAILLGLVEESVAKYQRRDTQTITQLSSRSSHPISQDDFLDRLSGGVGMVGAIETRLDIQQAMRALPDQIRAVMHGILIDSYTREELRQRLGLPYATVCNLAVEGFDLLRHALASYKR